MTDTVCVRERSWVTDERWWYERIYADGSRRVTCRASTGPGRQEVEMKWGVNSPWAIKRQQKATGDTDERELVAPRIDALVRQFEAADVDAETLAYAAYSLGWADARKKGRQVTPDTAGEHTPKVQT